MQNLSVAYYFKYYIGNESQVQLFNVIGTIALIIAIPLSKPLAKRFGKKDRVLASSSSQEFSSSFYTFPVLKTLLRSLHLIYWPRWPMHPLSPSSGPCLGILQIILNGKTAGVPRDWYSPPQHLRKSGMGESGSALAGWMLALFQFEANVEQTETALTGIRLMISGFPGILYMSCSILLVFYKIDQPTCILMQQELDQRRAGSE